MHRGLVILLSVGVLLGARVAQAQGQPPPDMKLDKAYVRRVVAAAIKTVGEKYVFADKRAPLVEAITRKLNAGEYDGITSALDLVPRMNQDFQAAAQDAHLRFGYSYEAEPMDRDPEHDSPEDMEKDRAAAYQQGFGIQCVERLPENIGYLKIDHMTRAAFASEPMGMAFHLLASTRALIVDLRENRGGEIDAVPNFISYFVEPEPVLLGEFFSGPENHLRQQWTLPYVPGPRYLNRPVFVLTSSQTFSGGEAVAYHLKRLGATVIGEKTRGGAHPSIWYNIDPHFAVSVPVLRPLGRTWEGSGVTPDVGVPAASALDEAKTRALEKLKAAAK